MNTVTIFGFECTLKFGFYNNNTVAIEAEARDESFLCCTVNWERNWEGVRRYDQQFQFPAVVLKNYGENEGIVAELEREGVVSKGGAYLSGSGGTVEVHKLTWEWEQIARKQLKLDLKTETNGTELN